MNAQRPKITAGKPTPQQPDPAEAWVRTRGAAPAEPKPETKRMTFDLEKGLHKRFRQATLKNDVDMTDALRDFVAAYVAQAEAAP